MNARPVEYRIEILKTWALNILLLLTLSLTACVSLAAPTAPSPSQTDAANHPPVILHVEEREETQNGRLLLSKDIYFTDPDGDATTVVNTLVAVDPPEFIATVGDDSITVPADEQKQGAMVTSAMRCPSSLRPFSLTIEDRIRERHLTARGDWLW